MRFWSKATRLASNRGICCLSSLRPRRDYGQRQPDWPPAGISAAFQVWMQDGILDRGNWIDLQPGNLLPFKFETKMRFWSKATRLASSWHICCLWYFRARLGPGQKQQNPASLSLSAAFGTFEQDWVQGRSSKILLPEACLLPLTLVSFIGHLAEAAKSCFLELVCCL